MVFDGVGGEFLEPVLDVASEGGQDSISVRQEHVDVHKQAGQSARHHVTRLAHTHTCIVKISSTLT